MGFMEIAAGRYSCRKYTGEEVAVEDLKKIVEAGALAPSGCNAQPWKFIVVNEPEAKAKLCDALVLKNGSTGAPWREEAGAFIVAVEEPARVLPAVEKYYQDTQRFAQGDLGMAVLNMCYMAAELEYDTCILGMIDQEKMEEYFGIPKGHEVRMTLAVGKGDMKVIPKKTRKPFEEICSFNKY